MAANRSASFLLIISSKAQKEIAQAWNWYEDRQQELGDRFVKEVTARFQKIEINPNRFPLRTKVYREAVVPIFPYLVIYKINRRKKSVLIVSVFHTALHPRKKYK